jgi:hypothetical protein
MVSNIKGRKRFEGVGEQCAEKNKRIWTYEDEVTGGWKLLTTATCEPEKRPDGLH